MTGVLEIPFYFYYILSGFLSLEVEEKVGVCECERRFREQTKEVKAGHSGRGDYNVNSHMLIAITARAFTDSATSPSHLSK